MAKHTARTTLSLAVWDAGPEFEVDMVVTFSVTKYRPATRLEPEEPASVENVTIRLFTGKGGTQLPTPLWVEDWFAEDSDFKGWLLSEARDQDEYDRDCKADADREARRLGL